jgi:maltokinase
LPELLDALALADGKRLAVLRGADGPAAVPMVRAADGQWRPARPGDGASEALLDVLSQTAGSVTRGAFTVQSWAVRSAAGERPIGVDQTNESVVVGDTAVVKWATHLQEGPHPAPRRIGVLRDAGFPGMPAPWGLVTWTPADGAETLVASVDAFLPGAVDGWTWAVDLITAAARDGAVPPAVDAATDVGVLVADLHSALAGTATVATTSDAARWRDAALHLLDDATALGDFPSVAVAHTHRDDIAAAMAGLGALTGCRVIEGHGDLHVGQVLCSRGRFVVTDFDGNPVLPAAQRALPIPAALDVAGMAQSLHHAAVVARRYTALPDAALARVDAAMRSAFLSAYTDRLASTGHADVYDARPLRAFRMQQILREMVYAARHLPRWMYVPDAALPALLEERSAA